MTTSSLVIARHRPTHAQVVYTQASLQLHQSDRLVIGSSCTVYSPGWNYSFNSNCRSWTSILSTNLWNNLSGRPFIFLVYHQLIYCLGWNYSFNSTFILPHPLVSRIFLFVDITYKFPGRDTVHLHTLSTDITYQTMIQFIWSEIYFPRWNFGHQLTFSGWNYSSNSKFILPASIVSRFFLFVDITYKFPSYK